MPPAILGLHHVTATVNDAQADLDFCLDALGLRLVKKTVNFDNHHVYHFYYGDERGTPGTIWTTFPYKGHGRPDRARRAPARSPSRRSRCRAARSASGAIALVALRHRGDESRRASTRSRSSFLDPSGLVIELVGTDDDADAVARGDGAGRAPRFAACTASR